MNISNNGSEDLNSRPSTHEDRAANASSGTERHGSWIVPDHRRVIVDLMHFQRELPMVAHDRRIDLTAMVEARKASAERISWTMLFIKAFGMVARETPELRQTFIPGLFPRIYQHGFSIATLALTRIVDEREQLFFPRFDQPDRLSLTELQHHLREVQEHPVKELFGDHLRIQKYPWLIRRIVIGLRFYFHGRKRVKRFGTFGLTTLAGQNTTIQKPICPVPYLMTYGPMDEKNRSTLTVSYDHRLLDGMQMARVLAQIESVINGQLANEVAALPQRKRISV